ncbi:MAG: hypothetical protein C5B53_03685 [Candidatus Melainabacteria bacterium]|nr:MAG: hypothetical protein C5B53_03685 [Candidatus Melainabacteria bacterium]
MAAHHKDDSWPVAQRLLLFEEPALKWLNLKRWLKRSALRQELLTGAKTDQTTQFARLVESQWANKPTSEKQLNRTLTALFAIEESKRFKKRAFERWRQHCDQELGAGKELPAPFQMGPEVVAWIEVISYFSPPWRVVAETGSGSEDPRGRFLIALLDQIPSGNAKTINWQELSLFFQETLKQWRTRLPGNFLPDLLVLVEGATETILLPLLALCLGIDLNALGAMLIPAGGANQVAKKYTQLKETAAIPIFCLLDSDAEQQKNLIASQLRPEDHLYTLKEGEIEDLIRIDCFVPLINRYLAAAQYGALGLKPVQESDFEPSLSRTATLERLWRERNLGKFDKVGFAKFLVEESKAAVSEGASQAVTGVLAGHEITPDGRLLIKTLAACQSRGGRGL